MSPSGPKAEQTQAQSRVHFLSWLTDIAPCGFELWDQWNASRMRSASEVDQLFAKLDRIGG